MAVVGEAANEAREGRGSAVATRAVVGDVGCWYATRWREAAATMEEEEGNVKQGKQRPRRKQHQWRRERLAAWLQVTEG
ncbi:hypothetical protein B296_00019318 [Ensete ventricosum]|uniref:Uncharacterized protein n=1 Tax=Ensete ventricosum TaxID=4639 RepID=A0A427ARF1_ENSVE|nr:hypothetical protein B296_00019318 [Ensete ventricosum]